MTILRLYAHNGHCADFWVQHRDWTNTCAHVASINGVLIGELPADAAQASGVTVRMEHFDVRSGRPVSPPEAPGDESAFTRIAEPAWSRRPGHRSIRFRTAPPCGPTVS